MKKIIFILLTGVLLFFTSDTKAQYIERDSTGIPHACTNYAYHNKQKENKRIVQGLIFIAACGTILAIEQATIPSQKESARNLSRQMGYTGIAVIGACVTVSLDSWNVRLQDKIGL